MRLIVTAVSVTFLSVASVSAGGGTVTSAEPGPPTLTGETTAEMLDTMGIEAATTTTVIYTPPARQSEPKEAEPAATESETETQVAASEPVTPRDVVRQCTTCHGLNGIAKIPTAPNMAGSSRGYLETQLKAFRSGRREHEVMSVIAENMNDEEIKAAAKWYSAIKVTAEVPE